MSNPMRYIKALEAVGFERDQAEAQVQIVLDAIEGDLVTKSDFAVFQERIENRSSQAQLASQSQFNEFEMNMQTQFKSFTSTMETRFKDFSSGMEARFKDFSSAIETRFKDFSSEIDRRLHASDQANQAQFKELEYRLITRLGFLTVSVATIAVAVLSWLIKVQ